MSFGEKRRERGLDAGKRTQGGQELSPHKPALLGLLTRACGAQRELPAEALAEGKHLGSNRL
jgi:hypothetical protein